MLLRLRLFQRLVIAIHSWTNEEEETGSISYPDRSASFSWNQLWYLLVNQSRGAAQKTGKVHHVNAWLYQMADALIMVACRQAQ